MNTNPLVQTIKPQKHSRSKEALELLTRLSNYTYQIMKKRNWKIKTLSEMYPKNPNLLGLNINRGVEVKIRLRKPSNPNEFLPFHDLLGTMLHELVHNRISPHDQSFYQLLDEIYKEYEDLVDSGFVVGTRLGGKKIDPLVAIEKRRWLQTIMPPGGQKLGGIKQQKPLKELIREAAIRRQRDSIWCSTHEHDIDTISSVLPTVDISHPESTISTTTAPATIPNNPSNTSIQTIIIPINQTVIEQMSTTRQSEILPTKKRNIQIIDLTMNKNPKPKKREYIVLDD